MSAEATAPKKVCVSCGGDVTNKPRTKDPQGKYYCSECYAKLQAQAAPAAAPAAKSAAGSKPAGKGPIPIAPSDDIMSKLAEEALAETAEQCPNCHRPWRKNSTLCTFCGFNSNSGKQMSTRVLKPEVPEGEKQYDRGSAGGGAASSNALLNYWLHPRDTVMAQIGSGSLGIPVLAFALSGVLNAYSGATAKAAAQSAQGAAQAVDVGIGPALAGGAIGGMLGGALLAFLYRVAGGMLGGTGTFNGMYIAMGWAQLPSLILSGVAAALAVSMGSDASTAQLVGVLVLASFVLGLVYTIAGISAAHEISVARAVATVLLSVLLVAGLVFGLVFVLVAGMAGSR